MHLLIRLLHDEGKVTKLEPAASSHEASMSNWKPVRMMKTVAILVASANLPPLNNLARTSIGLTRTVASVATDSGISNINEDNDVNAKNTIETTATMSFQSGPPKISPLLEVQSNTAPDAARRIAPTTSDPTAVLITYHNESVISCSSLVILTITRRKGTQIAGKSS